MLPCMLRVSFIVVFRWSYSKLRFREFRERGIGGTVVSNRFSRKSDGLSIKVQRETLSVTNLENKCRRTKNLEHRSKISGRADKAR